MIDYSKKASHDGDPEVLEIWHKAILELLVFDNKSVIDIGCGSGSFLSKIKGSTKKY
jgi:hypothetical protein